MKTKKSNRANSAKSVKANETKQVTNVVSVAEVNNTNVADYPVATKTGTEGGKVSSKEVLKAAGSIREIGRASCRERV